VLARLVNRRASKRDRSDFPALRAAVSPHTKPPGRRNFRVRAARPG
jgi:hypothetical protein